MKRDINGNLIWSNTDTFNSALSAVGRIFCLESKNKIGYFSESSQGKWFVTRNMTTGALIEINPKTVSYGFAPYSIGDSLVAVETGVSDNVVIMDEHGNIGRQFPIGENVNGFCEVRVTGSYLWLFGAYLTTNALVAKYNLITGQQLWRKNVFGIIQPRGNVDSLGNSYFGCSKRDSINNFYRIKLMKISPNGTILWDKEWLANPQWDSIGNQSIFASTVVVSQHEGIVVIGAQVQRDYQNNGWAHAYFMIRKIGNGDSVYATKFANNPSAQLNGVRQICFTKQSKMLVLGFQLVNAGTLTGWLKQYIADTLTGIQNKNGTVKTFSLSQNYPNPFNSSTALSFKLPAASNVRLVVYDILGREVVVLVNEKKLAGNYEAKFDGTNLPSGVYFYRIEAGDFKETKKMILVK